MQGGNLLSNEGLDPLALNFADAFLAEIQKVGDLAAVESLLEAAARELGFRHYAMVHHDDHREPRPGLINMHNYPAGYAEDYFDGQRHRDDPVIHACVAANACFTWCDLAAFITIDARHRDFLDRGARYGVSHGITVPAFVLGERSGSCNFCSPRAPDRVRRYVGTVQIVGSFAFQAARRIVNGGRLRQVRAARLQPRQRECVILAGQGKSNNDIAGSVSPRPMSAGSKRCGGWCAMSIANPTGAGSSRPTISTRLSSSRRASLATGPSPSKRSRRCRLIS